MLINNTPVRFTGFKEYSDKKTGQPKIILNLLNSNGFPETKFLDSTPDYLKVFSELQFGDDVIIEEHLNIK